MFRVLLLLIGFTQFSLGCLWDSDTLRDELRTKPSAYELITGQFPHHGDLYYDKRVSLIESKTERTTQEEIDLATAYTRLKRFVEAEKAFKTLLLKNPDSYEVNSNLGVLYKKQGKFKLAHQYIKTALSMKPEGHMGLGDWYLKRIAYEENSDPNLNFLGQEYKPAYFLGRNRTPNTEELKKIRYLKMLIINDRHFPDSYMVLGDTLLEIGDLNLALRAYHKAKILGHKNTQLVESRIEVIQGHIKQAIEIKQKGKISRKKVMLPVEEFTEADKWIEAFLKKEGELVSQGKFPSLAETEKLLKRQKYVPK